jgi:hypothetical protein
MRRLLRDVALVAACVTLVTAAIHASQAGANVSGPILGYVWGSADGKLRPLQGILGSATIGAPADPGFAITQALALDGRHFLVSTDVESSLNVVNTEGAPFVVAAIPNAPANPSLASGSRKGLAAVLYYAPERQLRIVSGLPSSPTVAYNIVVPPGISDLSRMAVRDDGNLLILVEPQSEHDRIYTWTPSSGLNLSMLADGVSDVALMKNGDAIVADAKANQVFSIIDPAGAAQKVILSDDKNGLPTPTSVAASDGNRIYIASAVDGTILTLDTTGRMLQSLKCGCRPSGLYPLSDSMYRLSSQTDRTIYLLKIDASSERVAFVPPLQDGK